MRYSRVWLITLLTVGLFSPTLYAAQKPDVKVGLILSMSGPYADYGMEIQRGIQLYMNKHGDTVAGRKIQIILKDDTGIAPPVARREAQELILNDHVDILAGFDFTPNTLAVEPLATRAKVPMVIMNAGASSLTEKSPYAVRTSMTDAQEAFGMAKWAYANGMRKVYVLVADFGPGHDVQRTFEKTFTKLGGTIVGSVRTPLDTVDYSAYLRRLVAAKPDAAFFFVPPGSSMVSLMKEIHQMDLRKMGIRVIGHGAMTDELDLSALGNDALGMITAFHYSQDHQSKVNRAFVAAYLKAWPNGRPDFMTVGGYDGMHLIYSVLRKTNGSTDAEAFVRAAEGMKWESPRGPVEIDPKTRDIIQNIYIRKVEKVDDVLQNVEFDTIKCVKDPEEPDSTDPAGC